MIWSDNYEIWPLLKGKNWFWNLFLIRKISDWIFVHQKCSNLLRTLKEKLVVVENWNLKSCEIVKLWVKSLKFFSGFLEKHLPEKLFPWTICFDSLKKETMSEILTSLFHVFYVPQTFARNKHRGKSSWASKVNNMSRKLNLHLHETLIISNPILFYFVSFSVTRQ